MPEIHNHCKSVEKEERVYAQAVFLALREIQFDKLRHQRSAAIAVHDIIICFVFLNYMTAVVELFFMKIVMKLLK